VGHHPPLGVWLWHEVSYTGESVADVSYTTFEMSALRVTARHEPDDTSVQRTNERFEGRAGLYDEIVSRVASRAGVGAAC
jgi:hypothetical protein